MDAKIYFSKFKALCLMVFLWLSCSYVVLKGTPVKTEAVIFDLYETMPKSDREKLEELVKDLKSLHYRTVLHTNSSKDDLHLITERGYFELFDVVIPSYRLGAEKPDPKAFTLLLQELKLNPESCLVIDENVDNILAAIKLKIPCIHYTWITDLVYKLRNRDIKVKIPKSKNNNEDKYRKFSGRLEK